MVRGGVDGPVRRSKARGPGAGETEHVRTPRPKCTHSVLSNGLRTRRRIPFQVRPNLSSFLSFNTMPPILTASEQQELEDIMATDVDHGTFHIDDYDRIMQTLLPLYVQAQTAKLTRKRKLDARHDDDATISERLVNLVHRVVLRAGAAKSPLVVQAVRDLIEQRLASPSANPAVSTPNPSAVLRQRSDTAQTIFRRSLSLSSPPRKRRRRAQIPPRCLVEGLCCMASLGRLSLSTILRFCSVSNVIREGLMTTPGVWTHITALTRRGIPALAYFLKLSGNEKLSIDISFASPDDAATVLASLHEHTNRISRLSLRSDVDMGDADQAFRIFFRQRATELESLHFHVHGLPEVLESSFFSGSKVTVLSCRASHLAKRLSASAISDLTLVGPVHARPDIVHPSQFLAMFPDLKSLTVEQSMTGHYDMQAPHVLDALHLHESAAVPTGYMNDLHGPSIPFIVLHGQRAEHITLALEHLQVDNISEIDYVAYSNTFDLCLTANEKRRRLMVDAEPCLARHLVATLGTFMNLVRVGISSYLEPHQILSFHRSLPYRLKTLELFLDDRARSASTVEMLTFKPRRQWELPSSFMVLRLTGERAFARDEDGAHERDVLRLQPKVSAATIIPFLEDHVRELSAQLTVEINAAEVEGGLGHESVHVLSMRVHALVVNGKLIDPLHYV
ncbi:hypothetical protein EXIGLDRAFT_459481 [Exidia glandulosa HHB12029]|uniref:Uncharacterized protein n=1 Tax=Exidia glandulosa HHB12029 TaxID=1314781 RepID=A0A165K4U6_EXIGL|nr:hypothetical protein EXIGLDRAFT_459481 [Exidia glandulosa HHB12029]